MKAWPCFMGFGVGRNASYLLLSQLRKLITKLKQCVVEDVNNCKIRIIADNDLAAYTL